MSDKDRTQILTDLIDTYHKYGLREITPEEVLEYFNNLENKNKSI